MTTSTVPRSSLPERRTAVVGLVLFLTVSAALLWWAKWSPYAGTALTLSGGSAWSGTSLLEAAGIRVGSGPSLAAGLSFTQVYVEAVWKAVLVGLVMAAGVQSLVSRAWLVRALSGGRTAVSALRGGLASTPSMMCSCCAAPVASALRRSGVPTAAAVAYWLGNPLLNPAVLVFLALVAPWQWTATRLLVGVLVVVGGSALVARIGGPDEHVGPGGTGAVPDDEPPLRLSEAPRRFATSFARLSLVVVPEYLVVVLAVGVFSGWLFPLGEDAASWGALAAVVAVALGTLLVIPTAGEIPLTQGLALAGLGGAVVGALLVVLPAVSLPSMVIVARALTWRVALASAGVVAAGGLLAAALLPVLSAL